MDLSFMHDKKFLVAAGVVGAVGLLALTKRQPSVQGTVEGAANGQASRTLYVPTSQYNIQANYGTQNTTTTSTTQNNNATNGGVINSPSTTAPAKAPAAQTAPVKVAVPATKDVVIQKGQTLWGIAEQYTGNGQNYKAIAQLNGIADPNKIFAGDHLKIQVGGTTTAKPATATAPKPAAAKTYTIKKGDTLTSIAKANGTTVSALQSKNGIKNANLIKVGQVIKL